MLRVRTGALHSCDAREHGRLVRCDKRNKRERFEHELRELREPRERQLHPGDEQERFTHARERECRATSVSVSSMNRMSKPREQLRCVSCIWATSISGESNPG